jgi:hypothetical protein
MRLIFLEITQNIKCLFESAAAGTLHLYFNLRAKRLSGACDAIQTLCRSYIIRHRVIRLNFFAPSGSPLRNPSAQNVCSALPRLSTRTKTDARTCRAVVLY